MAATLIALMACGGDGALDSDPKIDSIRSAVTAQGTLTGTYAH